MRTHHTFVAVLALLASAGAAGAQQSRSRAATPDADRARTPRRTMVFDMMDADRPRLGITLGESGRGDTLGVLVEEVTEDGPAAKAGVKEGDRITAINGVNLKVAREDADVDEVEGIGSRRLMRELGKLDAGDTVELKLWRDGAVRTVTVKTVEARALTPAWTTQRLKQGSSGAWETREERAVLGLGLGASGSRRDTLGVLIASLDDDGPAAKAGIEEGERIAAINGVDLRVPREDAGDWEMSSARMRRLSREMEKLRPGDEVELRLYRAGQFRTVKLRTVAAKDLPQGGQRSFFFGDGDRGFPGSMNFVMPRISPRMMRWDALPPDAPEPPVPPVPQVSPAPPVPPSPPRIFYDDGDGPREIRLRVGPEFQGRIDEAMRRAMQLRRIRPRVRVQLDGLPVRAGALAI